ncbi:MAG: hypothetical protein AAFY47_10325 [Pseudomonadota bacterium]
MQTSIMKRINDSDFVGFSYYSIVSTVNQVSEQNDAIKESEQRISSLKTRSNTIVEGDTELNQADRKVDRVSRDAFRELLLGAGPRLAAGQTRLTNARQAEGGTVARVDFVLNAEGDAPASEATPDAGPATLVRACEKAQQVSGRYTNLGEQIPPEMIRSTVDGCLLSNRTAGLSEETSAQLASAKRAFDEKFDQKQEIKDEIAEIEAAIAYEESEIDAIEAKIRDNTDLPDGAEARTPLEIYRLFPEVANYDFTGLGVGEKLLMIQHELILGLLTALAGAVGGLSKFFLRRYTRGPDSKVVGEGGPRMADEFMPTCLAGSFAGLSVFLILFGGLAVFQTGGNEAGATANYSSFAAFGFLAGMFSDRVNAWLESIAGRVFSKAEEANAQRVLNELTEAQASKDQSRIEEILKARVEERERRAEEAAAAEQAAQSGTSTPG